MVEEFSIRELPDEVRSKLRSGIAITSIAQCIEELVLNAIDGKATCIAVRVDLSIYRIQVVDNGVGILEKDLMLVGTRYATSKCHTLEDLNENLSLYGFRGEALVLGQVDNKFVAITFTCSSSLAKKNAPSTAYNLVALVDQHAADERVQLENVLNDSYTENQQLKRTNITPLEMNFRPEEVRIMKAYKEAFLDIGLDITLVNDDAVLFHTLPCCLVAQDKNERYTRRCQNAAKVIEATVKEMCEDIRVMGGATDITSSRPLPNPLRHVMNTIACKSAVKFGDALSVEKCQKLIKSLRKCKLPFQCAHGRPSLIPVVDLNYLQLNSMVLNKPRPNLRKLIYDEIG